MTAHDAIVTEIEELAPSLMQITVSLTDEGFRFKAGQWVNFRFPDGLSRPYTIASAPERPGAVQLCVRVGEGRGGEALRRLEAGEIVALDGPFGRFVLPPNDDRNIVFLAGDTGIAPVRSIVLHLLATKDPRTITVLYEPDQRYILYAGDFDPLARAGDIVHMSGAIEPLIERNRKALTDGLVMAVGFDPFLDRAQKAMESMELPWDDVISESFGAQP